MAILNTEYQDILGINPKYRNAISSLGLKANNVFQAVVNKCAYNILHYDEIKALHWYYQYTFGIERNKAGEFIMLPFTARQIVNHCNVPAPGATLAKLISLGLLVKHSKYDGVYNYCIPNDLFTTNDLSIKFYNPDIPQF